MPAHSLAQLGRVNRLSPAMDSTCYPRTVAEQSELAYVRCVYTWLLTSRQRAEMQTFI